MAFGVLSETAKRQSIVDRFENDYDALVFPISNSELAGCCVCETDSRVMDSSHVHKSNIRRSRNRYRFTRAMTEVIQRVEFMR